MNLQGKVAFVSAAAQGIGRAIAEEFASAGASVVAADIAAEKLDEAFRNSPDVRPVTLDMRDETALRECLAGQERLDILVNCVGWVADGTIVDCSADDFRKSIELNVYPAFVASQVAVASALAKERPLSIINISSVISSVSAAKRRFAYGMSKAALIGMTKSVALDYVQDGIRCNAICPGTIESPSLVERMETFSQTVGGMDRARTIFNERQPIGRLGRPDEVAKLAVFLASDHSSFVTGSTYNIDGGWSL